MSQKITPHLIAQNLKHLKYAKNAVLLTTPGENAARTHKRNASIARESTGH